MAKRSRARVLSFYLPFPLIPPAPPDDHTDDGPPDRPRRKPRQPQPADADGRTLDQPMLWKEAA